VNGAFDWERVQADFPVNSHLIWLNNCGTTPVSSPVLTAVKSWLDEYSRRGSLAEGYGYGTVKASIYGRLESMINAHPGELALMHNTAEGMNMLSHGLFLEPGEEILLLENEYPSNVYPWDHWREKGVLLKTIPLTSDPDAFVKSFAAALTPRTRVAALSAVHWCTGLPLPLAAIGALCREHGVEFIVDGSQGVGMIDIDVKAMGISCMAFSAWKWLLGPVGVGMLYIAREKLESIRPIFKGTESVVRDTEYLPYKHILKPSTERFILSTGNMNDWIYFDASLAYLEAIGFARVRARVNELARYIADGLGRLGFNVLPGLSESRSGVVSAAKPGLDSALAVKALKACGIIAAERLGRIRFAPHIYISTGQLDKVLSELASV
jgi:cysteine desulfurase/selenocysteine lyase